MSTLRSVLDELRVEDLRSLSDDEVAGRLDELEQATRLIEAERARSIAEVERRGSFGVDGHLSVTSWLADRHRVSHAVAASQVRVARVVEQVPRIGEALPAGDISTTAASLLASAHQSAPEAFARSEEFLLEAARMLPVAGLARAVQRFRQLADADDDERRFQRRGLHASTTLDGMVRVDGDLDPECGQHLITALRAAMDADLRSSRDERTPAQRRADALGHICRSYLDRADRPTAGGERPHVMVLVDVQNLQRRCELADAGPIGAESARRLACDANVSRVILGPGSVPLELGRRTKVVPAALRRALVVRDGHCRFPGCDRPPSWCDAHHVRHWADGGETSLGNLVLLCRPHHRAIHRGFGVAMVGGRPEFRRPDGTPLEDRGPPLAAT